MVKWNQDVIGKLSIDRYSLSYFYVFVNRFPDFFRYAQNGSAQVRIPEAMI